MKEEMMIGECDLCSGVACLADALDVCGRQWAIIGEAGVRILDQRKELPTVIDVVLGMDPVSPASLDDFAERMRECDYFIGRLLEDDSGNVTNVRMAKTSRGPTVDVHVRSTGLERAIIEHASLTSLAQLTPRKIPVGRLGHIAAVEIAERNSPRHERSAEFLANLVAGLSAGEMGRAVNAVREMSRTPRFSKRDLSGEMQLLVSRGACQ